MRCHRHRHWTCPAVCVGPALRRRRPASRAEGPDHLQRLLALLWLHRCVCELCLDIWGEGTLITNLPNLCYSMGYTVSLSLSLSLSSFSSSLPGSRSLCCCFCTECELDAEVRSDGPVLLPDDQHDGGEREREVCPRAKNPQFRGISSSSSVLLCRDMVIVVGWEGGACHRLLLWCVSSLSSSPPIFSFIVIVALICFCCGCHAVRVCCPEDNGVPKARQAQPLEGLAELHSRLRAVQLRHAGGPRPTGVFMKREGGRGRIDDWLMSMLPLFTL